MKTNNVFKKLAMTENMKINISSKDFKVTEAIESKILHKIAALDKYFKGNKQIKVNLYTRSDNQEVEIMIDVNNNFLKANAKTEDLYKSIDLVVENLKNQLSKLSDKESENDRNSIRFFEAETQIKEKEEKGPKIVKRKLITAKPMFEEEAILQMDLLNHRSFIFINAETNEPCMTYKRNDGDYGIIELA